MLRLYGGRGTRVNALCSFGTSVTHDPQRRQELGWRQVAEGWSGQPTAHSTAAAEGYTMSPS
jgi:hypothetical protein